MFALQQVVKKIQGASQQKQVGSIGLEFAMEKMYLVQLQKNSTGEIELRANSAFAYPCSRDELLASPKMLKSIVRQVLKQAAFTGNKVVTTLPTQDLRLMSIAYQVSKGINDNEAILSILNDRIDGSLQDFVVDYLPIRFHSGDEERLALVAVARRETVYAYLESIRLAGFTVDALDIAPSAIKRLIFQVSDSNQFENSLVINFGQKKSYMTLISGERLLFDQSIDFGENSLLERISKALDLSTESTRELVYKHGLVARKNDQDSTAEISHEEVADALLEIVKPDFIKLVNEINHDLIYAASETRGEPVKNIYLLGSIARWHGVDKVINRMIDIPVSLPNFLAKFGNNEEIINFQGSLPEMAVAAGLALRGMTGHG